jgi:hypothetical protein
MPFQVTIHAETQAELKHALEAVWTSIQTDQPENTLKPYTMRDHTIMVRRGAGGDYGWMRRTHSPRPCSAMSISRTA